MLKMSASKWNFSSFQSTIFMFKFPVQTKIFFRFNLFPSSFLQFKLFSNAFHFFCNLQKSTLAVSFLFHLVVSSKYVMKNVKKNAITILNYFLICHDFRSNKPSRSVSVLTETQRG